MIKTIGILGCGWLGLPLALAFIEDKYVVHGSTTSEEKQVKLRKKGICPFTIMLSDNQIKGNLTEFLKNIDTLIINVPPKSEGSNKGSYVSKMQLLCDAIETFKIKNILFVSSTSVYGDVEGEVTEETVPHPTTESSKQLLLSENIFRINPNFQTTVIRFGGLIGPNRHPITMLSGKKELANGNAAVNLIHQDDCIGIIQSVVQNDWWNETFNGVSPQHPKKKDYYTSEAQKRKLPLPSYLEKSTKKDKKINSYSLIPIKKYRFKTSILS